MKHIAKLSGLFLVLMVAATHVLAQDSTKALKEIGTFADHMCQTAPLKGKSEELMLSGKGNAELKGLISKIVNLGVTGAAGYKQTVSEGVLQKDTATLISKNIDCKRALALMLIDRLIPKVEPTKKASSIENNKLSLSPPQERFLELLSSYQTELGARKLIVDRTNGGLYFDDPQHRKSQLNFIIGIYGSVTPANTALFDELMDSMPPEYVRFFPESRLDSPFVISVTEEGKAYLMKNTKSISYGKQK